MGKFLEGILGHINGKIGTVIGSSWKGVEYVKSKKRSGRKTFSAAQLEQQAKFALAVEFLNPMNLLLETTYRGYAKKMTGVNNALSQVISETITGTYPNFTIDYSKVQVAKGKLVNAKDASVIYTAADKKLRWTWVSNSGKDNAKEADRAIYVAYCPAKKKCTYTLFGAQRIEEGNGVLLDVSEFVGEQVHTYLSFKGDKATDIATSIYTGAIIVTS